MANVLDVFPSSLIEGNPVKIGVNYTEESLHDISPIDKILKVITEIFKGNIVIEANPRIGLFSLRIASHPKVDYLLAYESNRELWTMWWNNIGQFRLSTKANGFNSEINIGEDLALLQLSLGKESNTVALFNIDSETDDRIKLSGLTLEEWGKYICYSVGCKGVIFNIPLKYTLEIPGQTLINLDRNKLVIFTPHAEYLPALKELGAVGDTIIPEVPVEIKRPVPEYKQELEDIPSPALTKGPKIVLQTFLSNDFPQREYFREPLNPKAIHHGQRKLLLSEIEFLTRVIKKTPGEYLMLYVGAGPGDHIPILSEMFPEVRFELYDPAPFSIKETDKIKIHRELFTDDIVKKFVGTPNLLFVSDIRSTPTKNYKFKDEDNADPEFEEEVRKNLDQQKRWVLGLSPLRSLLKFRFPFIEGETEYFDGIIFFQAYPPGHSTETRLEVGPKPKMIKYNHTKYERQMFYFNTQYRIQSFRHYDSKFGWSYDTIREYFILKKYFEMRGQSSKAIGDYFERFDGLTNKPEKKISQILKRRIGEN